MNEAILIAVTIPSVTALVGILLSNRQYDHVNARINDLNLGLNKRIDDLNRRIDEVIAGQRRMEEVIDARLRLIEEKLGIR